ncbi:MAG: hypothetical protein KGL39_59130 [Patescibacteria group bacterium]|nr:hypothetical protein [Patescibacteria group bacterium]
MAQKFSEQTWHEGECKYCTKKALVNQQSTCKKCFVKGKNPQPAARASMETWAEYSRHALENHIPLAEAARDFHARHGNPSPWEHASTAFHTKLGGFLSQGMSFPEALRRAREGGEELENPGKAKRLLRRADRHWRTQAMSGSEMREGVRKVRDEANEGSRAAARSVALIKTGGSRRLMRFERTNPSTSTDTKATIGLLLGIAGLVIAGRVLGGSSSCGTCAAASQQPPPMPTMSFYPGGSR